ncbi:hypothetical protein ACYFX5_26695 [Bremerella sp. T1]|uniref:hypothetical protein n=1 Tax=Bremerella sp. TYQ1 TaxID=3119568 RepID=UPI001CCB6BCB|nr:hypothetical protein [Bremerella volcania]UBM36600.1 hypothetical protein LA756_01550 [Bremerella volcania]
MTKWACENRTKYGHTEQPHLQIQGTKVMNAPAQLNKSLSNAAFDNLREAALRIRTPKSACDLWEQVFSPRERLRLHRFQDVTWNKDDACKMWVELHSCSKVRAVIEIAHVLHHLSSKDYRWLLQETGELIDTDASYKDAIPRNDLVLNSLDRKIFWKGAPIVLDWSHDAKWYFMWELARQAKAGLSLDRLDFAPKKHESYLSKVKSDLAKHDEFPDELAVLIEPCEIGTQKLQLPPEQIRLFEHHLGGEIREWLP